MQPFNRQIAVEGLRGDQQPEQQSEDGALRPRPPEHREGELLELPQQLDELNAIFYEKHAKEVEKRYGRLGGFFRKVIGDRRFINFDRAVEGNIFGKAAKILTKGVAGAGISALSAYGIAVGVMAGGIPGLIIVPAAIAGGMFFGKKKFYDAILEGAQTIESHFTSADERGFTLREKMDFAYGALESQFETARNDYRVAVESGDATRISLAFQKVQDLIENGDKVAIDTTVPYTQNSEDQLVSVEQTRTEFSEWDTKWKKARSILSSTAAAVDSIHSIYSMLHGGGINMDLNLDGAKNVVQLNADNVAIFNNTIDNPAEFYSNLQSIDPNAYQNILNRVAQGEQFFTPYSVVGKGANVGLTTAVAAWKIAASIGGMVGLGAMDYLASNRRSSESGQVDMRTTARMTDFATSSGISDSREVFSSTLESTPVQLILESQSAVPAAPSAESVTEPKPESPPVTAVDEAVEPLPQAEPATGAEAKSKEAAEEEKKPPAPVIKMTKTEIKQDEVKKSQEKIDLTKDVVSEFIFSGKKTENEQAKLWKLEIDDQGKYIFVLLDQDTLMPILPPDQRADKIELESLEAFRSFIAEKKLEWEYAENESESRKISNFFQQSQPGGGVQGRHRGGQ